MKTTLTIAALATILAVSSAQAASHSHSHHGHVSRVDHDNSIVYMDQGYDFSKICGPKAKKMAKHEKTCAAVKSFKPGDEATVTYGNVESGPHGGRSASHGRR